MSKDNNNMNITDEINSDSSQGTASVEALKHSNRLSTEQQQELNIRTNGILVSNLENSSDLHSTSTCSQRYSAGNSMGTVDSEGQGAVPDLPRREENPFSFKHFLKRDSSLGGGAVSTNTSATGTVANGTNINHSRSASNINGNNNCGNSSSSCTSNGNNLINNNVNSGSSTATIGNNNVGQTRL